MPYNRVAILIDGGFYTQMFKKNNKNVMPNRQNVENLIMDIMGKIPTNGGLSNSLLRTFYYDSLPFSKTIKDLKGNQIDYSKSTVYVNQTKYLNSLRTIDQFALRLGELSFSGWKLNSYKPSSSKPIPDFRQKGVDMKIGLDMAWIAGKRTVDKMVLVTGDSDFISPMKLVRREGLMIYLYTMGSTYIKAELKEHADFII